MVCRRLLKWGIRLEAALLHGLAVWTPIGTKKQTGKRNTLNLSWLCSSLRRSFCGNWRIWLSQGCKHTKLWEKHGMQGTSSTQVAKSCSYPNSAPGKETFSKSKRRTPKKASSSLWFSETKAAHGAFLLCHQLLNHLIWEYLSRVSGVVSGIKNFKKFLDSMMLTLCTILVSLVAPNLSKPRWEWLSSALRLTKNDQ